MLRKVRAALALLCLLTATSIPSFAAPGVGEWTMYGNGPEHNGYYPRTIGAAPFTADWKRTFTTTVNQVAVSGDAVYGTLNAYFGSGQKAFALSVTDGADRWNYPLAQGYSVNPPAYSAGRVYFQRCDNSGDTHLWCLDAATGSLKWAAPHGAQWEKYLAPTVADGGVFIDGGSYGGMYGFDAVTGAQRFFIGQGQEDGWTPGYANGVVYSCVNGTLIATNPTTGSQLWTRTLTAASSYWYEGDVPVLADGKLILRVPGRVIVLDVATRAQTWSVDNTAFSGTPAVADGIVYVLAGAVVKAYNLADGSVVGTYTATGTLSGQPLLTKDLLLVSNGTSTYIFNRTTFAQQQVLPAGGALSYAAGRLYIATSANILTTYVVAATEADPAPQGLPVDPGPQPHPNPDLTLGTTTATWLDATRSGDLAYFLFDSPAKIERYNTATGAWLKPISLPSTPKGFTVSSGAIYVSFGTSISAFALDGSTETVLGNTVFSITSLVELNGKLYLGDAGASNFTVMNETTGAIAGSSNFFYSETGLTLAATKNKLFGVSVGISPSDILQTVINADGTLGAQTDSPYHGTYPTGTRTFLFGGEGRVATNAGIIYSTGDLSYLGSLAGAFTDGDFSGSSPVLLRNNTLVGYSASLLETGRKTLAGSPSRIFVANGQIASFAFQSGRGVAETLTPLSALVPADPGQGIDPTNLNYTPDAIEFGTGDIVYLLSKLHQSVFRWSVAERRYLASIPLAEAPQFFTYSAAQNRFYLSYSTGRISKIDLDTSLAEVNFANSPLAPQGLVAAGEFLFVEDASGAWATHYIYGSDGVLLSSKEWNYYSTEYIWNATNRKMYFFRDDTSPNDVLWEDVDLEGLLGTETDSPYHGTYSIVHPLRVSPDGTKVVLGNGDLYAGVSLQRLGTLGITLTDAVWLNGTLVTVSPNSSSGLLQSWSASNQAGTSVATPGVPVRMFGLSDGLLLVTQTARGVAFLKAGSDLQQVSLDPTYTLAPPTATTVPATNVSDTTVTLGGTADSKGQPTTAYFEYGTTTAYGVKTASQSVSSVAGAQSVVQDITSLQPNTTYNFRLVAVNGDGTSYGSNQTFQTGAAKPFVYSPSLANLTTTSVQIGGYIHPSGSATAAYVEYGTSALFGQTTASVDLGAGNAPVSFTRTLTGLLPGTKYFYRLVGSNAGGVTYGGTYSFSTLLNAPSAPVSGNATSVGVASAVLHGVITPTGVDTFVSFQFGTTASANQYGTIEGYVGNGTTAIPVQVLINSLAPATTYYYRIVARTASGTVLGNVLSFTTTSAALPPLVAVNDRVFLTGRQPVVINVLANDTGALRSNLTIASVNGAIGGKVTINPDQTLTYQPYSFVVAQDTFTYQVHDTAGRTASASVTVRSSWRGAEGGYDALVGAADSPFEKTGSVRAAVTAGGSFTGALWLGSTATIFRGKLQPDSTAVLLLKTAKGPVTLAFALDVDTNQLAGTVTVNQEALPFAASRVMQDTDRPRPLAGRYTLLLTAPDSATAAEGSGFASLLVDSHGGAWFTGRSPDGTAFSATAAIGADGRLPIYAVQGLKKQMNLHGWATFEPAPGNHELDGTVGWSTATTPGSIGLSVTSRTLTLAGSSYVAPTGKALAISLPAGTGNSVVQFGSAGVMLTQPMVATLLHSQLTVTGGGLSNVTMNLTTGLFSGVVTVSGHRSPFYGAFFQHDVMASGVYLGPSGPGWLSLSAPALGTNAANP